MALFTIVGVLAWLPAIRIYATARRMASTRMQWLLTSAPIALAAITLPGIAWWWWAFGYEIALANLAMEGLVAVVASGMIFGQLWLIGRWRRAS